MVNKAEQNQIVRPCPRTFTPFSRSRRSVIHTVGKRGDKSGHPLRFCSELT